MRGISCIEPLNFKEANKTNGYPGVRKFPSISEMFLAALM